MKKSSLLLWMFVFWALFLSIFSAVWSIRNQSQINKLKENEEQIVRITGDEEWLTLLD